MTFGPVPIQGAGGSPIGVVLRVNNGSDFNSISALLINIGITDPETMGEIFAAFTEAQATSDTDFTLILQRVLTLSGAGTSSVNNDYAGDPLDYYEERGTTGTAPDIFKFWKKHSSLDDTLDNDAIATIDSGGLKTVVGVAGVFYRSVQTTASYADEFDALQELVAVNGTGNAPTVTPRWLFKLVPIENADDATTITGLTEGVPRSDDPVMFAEIDLETVVVSGAGMSAVNGTYRRRTSFGSLSRGRPYYTLLGQADSDPEAAGLYSIYYYAGQWYITDSVGDQMYESTTAADHPRDAVWVEVDGALPVPTVTQDATLKQTTVRDIVALIPSEPLVNNLTTTANDIGRCFDQPDGAAGFTVTIDDLLPYESGTCWSFSNLSTNALAITLSDDPTDLVLVGGGSTGAKSLAQYGSCVVRLSASGKFLISGINVT